MRVNACLHGAGEAPVSRRAFHSLLLGARLHCPWSRKQELETVVGPQKPSLQGK